MSLEKCPWEGGEKGREKEELLSMLVFFPPFPLPLRPPHREEQGNEELEMELAVRDMSLSPRTFQLPLLWFPCSPPCEGLRAEGRGTQTLS
jgi:hypothetical protein